MSVLCSRVCTIDDGNATDRSVNHCHSRLQAEKYLEHSTDPLKPQTRLVAQRKSAGVGNPGAREGAGVRRSSERAVVKLEPARKMDLVGIRTETGLQ